MLLKNSFGVTAQLIVNSSLHPSNALLSIPTFVVFIITLVRFQQSMNALPIETTELGMTIVLKLMHILKHFSPIDLRPCSGRLTYLRHKQSSNILSDRLITDGGIIADSI